MQKRAWITGGVIAALGIFYAAREYRALDDRVKSAQEAAQYADSRAEGAEKRITELEAGLQHESAGREGLERRMDDVLRTIPTKQSLFADGLYDFNDVLIDSSVWEQFGKSVAVVEVEQRYLTENGGRNTSRFGNAVAIAADADEVYFATAYHNFDVELLGSTRTIKYIVQTGNRCEGSIVAIDKKADIAIFSAPSDIPPLACGWAEPEKYAVGQLALLLTHSHAMDEHGCLAYNPVVSYLKRITATRGYSVDGVPAGVTFLADVDINPADSGGPVFVFLDGKPLFAGLARATHETEKQSSIVNIEPLRKLMEENGLAELVRK